MAAQWAPIWALTTNVVQSKADAYNRSKRLILTRAPAGTREKVTTWKIAFYHIAQKAKVPIVCGFIDYKHKTIGIGPVLSLSGDMESIKTFYAPFSGKHMEEPS